MRLSRLVLSLLALALPAAIRAADECDCSKVPFSPDPPCFDTCSAVYLAVATREDLLHRFRLQHDIVSSIEAIPHAERPASISGYSKILYPEQEERFRLAVKELRKDSLPQLVERLRANGVDPSRVPREPDIGELLRSSTP